MAEDLRRAAFREGGGRRLPSLYVHVPFCPFRCAYCDFDFTTRTGGIDAYLDALSAEAAAVGGLARPETVFFGGGTPSLLSGERFEGLVRGLEEAIPVGNAAEFSIEANPETVTAEKTRLWKDLGVTRVSLGVQTFSDARLAALGRRSKETDARRAWEVLRQTGFDLNLDLIYGVPGAGLAEWREDLDAAVLLAPDHVSVYALTVEEKTPLGLAVRCGKVRPVAEDLSAGLYREAVERLAEAGLARYEVSNFARPGRECRHNLHTWRGGEYLGLGASAASFIGAVRGANQRGEWRYRERMARAGTAFRAEQVLDSEARAREKVLLALRLAEGAALADVRRADLPGELAGFLEDGLLAERDGRIVPTDKGFLFADEISAACV